MKQEHVALPLNFHQEHNLTSEPYRNDKEAHPLTGGTCQQAQNWRGPRTTYHGAQDLNTTISQLLWDEAAQVRFASTSEGYSIVLIRVPLYIRDLQPFLMCVCLETSTGSVDCHTEDISLLGAYLVLSLVWLTPSQQLTDSFPPAQLPPVSQSPYSWGLKKFENKQPLKFTLKPKSPSGSTPNSGLQPNMLQESTPLTAVSSWGAWKQP